MSEITGAADELVGDIRFGLLAWQDFIPGSRALYVGNRNDALAKRLAERGLDVVCTGIEDACAQSQGGSDEETFRYIVAVEALEQIASPMMALHAWRRLLDPDGKLLLGVNNRLGLRYFCGDRDKYTERSFDGIEGYRRAYAKKEDAFHGRMYSKAEWEGMLEKTGWAFFRFYAALPSISSPALIYADGCLPNEDLANRLFPVYHSPETVFLEEETLYDSVISNGMFHATANGYLIECSPVGEFSDVRHVTCSMERGREAALLTVIRGNGTVEKKAAWPEGVPRLEQIAKNGEALKRNGVPVVDAKMESGRYVMPYVDAEVGQVYLKRLLLEDPEKFLQEMDRFCDIVLQSSDHVKEDAGDGEGAVLRKGYPDLIPLNSFHIGDRFVFYDQEFCEDMYPANGILIRVIQSFYAGNFGLNMRYPMEELLKRYGLVEQRARWERMSSDFMRSLRNDELLAGFREHSGRNMDAINANRQRMNFSSDDYHRLFVDIFANADTRKLVLFGSGKFAEHFFTFYAEDYPVAFCVDNNEGRWGTKLHGVEIRSPQALKGLSHGEYKVLICIKNYLSVMRQLDGMGIHEYSIYDPGKAYPRKRHPIPMPTKGEGKKYHVGYIAGVFDLFHVGHLNLFKRAKELCDYLIVGVVTDEGVREFKGVEPFVPFEERIELVRSCRYVDEAVEIPFQFRGTRDAWRLHHFDVQFSGSDYANDKWWRMEKDILEAHGATMEFFPYTESTSSSKLKQLIERKLV